MAQQIKLKRSAVAGRVPTTSSLDLGEIAINTADGKLYFQRGDSTIQSFFTTNTLITGSLQQSGSDSYFLSNVGIGTTTPQYSLHVDGDIGVSEYIKHSGDDNTNIRLLADRLQLTAGGNIVLDYDESGTSTLDIAPEGKADIDILNGTIFVGGNQGSYQGNVGIGTDSPAQPLHVAGNARVDGDFYIIESNPQIFLADTNHNSDYSINLNSGLFSITDTTNNATRITVNSSGNVGIGTSSPTSKLHVSGAADVLLIEGSGSTANTSIFAIDGNNGRLFEVSDDLSDSLFSVNTIAGLPIVEVFADNRVTMGAFNQNDFVISGSKVGIGTAAPNATLDVQGSKIHLGTGGSGTDRSILYS